MQTAHLRKLYEILLMSKLSLILVTLFALVGTVSVELGERTEVTNGFFLCVYLSWKV